MGGLVEEEDDSGLELDVVDADVLEDLVDDDMCGVSCGVGLAFGEEAADLVATVVVLAAGDDLRVVGEARQRIVARW